MDYPALYRRIYALLVRTTPLAGDCGSLCRARCCRGGKDDGMMLFPHEEELASKVLGLTITERPFGDDSKAVLFASCSQKGRCVRAMRPLACRVFPLAPRIENGVLSVRPDPRAFALCPLVQLHYTEGENGKKNDSGSGASVMQEAFIAAVTECYELLLSAPDTAEFVQKLSNSIDEYQRFMPSGAANT